MTVKVDRSHQIQPMVANSNATRAVVRVTRKADPKRLDRIADILLDIVETANRLDSANTPGELPAK